MLVWESDEYIGRGRKLLVTPGHYEEISIEGSLAVAFLLWNATNEHGQQVIVSRLNITVVPNFENFSITCRDVDHTDTVTFHKTSTQTFVYII